jgi:DNA-binding NarL/FixJ family response regulator
MAPTPHTTRNDAEPSVGSPPLSVESAGHIVEVLAASQTGDVALGPLLERILLGAAHLLGCRMGSICTIDEAAQVYRKEVDIGDGCRAGQVFSLNEGVTGAVVRAGGSVVFNEYSEVPGGHLGQDDARYQRPVIGVPIRLESGLIGACVVFANSAERHFTSRDARVLELFATQAASAIADFRLHTVAIELSNSLAELHRTERAALSLGFEALVDDGRSSHARPMMMRRPAPPHHRVLVLHEQPMMRAGLVHLLVQDGTGIEVVAAASTAASALSAAEHLQPDVVVTDIDVIDLPGTDLIESLTHASPGTTVVVLVGDPDDERIRQAAHSGARGFLNRSADGPSLVRAIISAAAGDALLSGSLVARWGEGTADPDHLTPREREVRRLVASGLRDKQIGIELGISAKTVEKHVGTILRKTGAANRTMLAGLGHSR